MKKMCLFTILFYTGLLSQAQDRVLEKGGRLEVSPSAFSATLGSGKTTQKSMLIENHGAANLTLKFEVVNPFLQKNLAETAILLRDSPASLNSIALSPTTGHVYARALNGRGFYRYDPVGNTWLTLADAPNNSGNYGTGLWYNGKVYFHYSNRYLDIYDIATNLWSSYYVSAGYGLMTHFESKLYILDYNRIVVFNTLNQTVSDLRPPSTPLVNSLGGMSYRGGFLYYHPGNGATNFFRYSFTNNTWNELSPSEVGLGHGSASNDEYYFVNTVGAGGAIFSYDFEFENWRQAGQTPFKVVDGKLAISEDYLFITQGTAGTGFARFPFRDWGYVKTSQLVIEAGQSLTMDICFDAFRLASGAYELELRITSNDPTAPLIQVPLNLQVTDGPAIEFFPEQLDFGLQYPNVSASRPLKVANIGNATLIVKDIAASHPAFRTEMTEFIVAPGKTKLVDVEIQAPVAGSYAETLIFQTNDGLYHAPLLANVENRPTLVADPPALAAAILSGTQQIEEILLTNTGGQDLIVTPTLEYAGTVQNWIQLQPLANPIGPGLAEVLQLEVDATGLIAGVYDATLTLATNDPLQATSVVPIVLTVSGSPSLSVTPLVVDFGETFVNGTSVRELLLENTGTADLQVSAIESDTAEFTAYPNSFVLAPGETKVVLASFQPVANGLVSGMFTIQNNDQPVSVSLSGEGIAGPVIAVSPGSLELTLPFGQITQQMVTISNTGSNLLEGTLRATGYVSEKRVEGYFSNPFPDLETLANSPLRLSFVQEDPETGLLYAQERSGRNFYTYDPFHNTWTKFFEAAVPTSSQSARTIVRGVLAIAHALDPNLYLLDLKTKKWTILPLEAGTSNMGDDGNLLYLIRGNSFFSLDPVSLVATPLTPPDVILDDKYGTLDFHNGYLYHSYSASSFLFDRFNIASGEWEDLKPMPRTFLSDGAVMGNQIWFITNDQFVLYDIIKDSWSVQPAPEGMYEDSAFAYSEPFYYFGIYGSSVPNSPNFFRFRFQDWVKPGETFFSVPAGDSQTIPVEIDTHGLSPGHHSSQIRLESNDPLNPVKLVPISLQVIPGPALEVFPSTLSFADVPVGGAVQERLFLRNQGQTTLVINDITFDHPDFSTDFAGESLDPDETIEVMVTFSPSAPGETASILAVQSNGPGVEVGLLGNGISPPTLSLDTSPIEVVLEVDQTYTHTLTLTNNGLSDLVFRTQAFEHQIRSMQSLGPQLWNTSEDGAEGSAVRRDVLELMLADLSDTHLGVDSWEVVPFVDLHQRGATISNLNNPDNFNEFDIVWLATTRVTWNQARIDELRRWIAEGGSLILLCREVHSYFNSILPQGFGLGIENNNAFTQTTERINPYTPTVGVERIYSREARTSLKMTAPAFAMVMNNESLPGILPDRPLVAATYYGNGKIVVLGNDLFSSINFPFEDNQRLMNQLVDWMIQKKLPWLTIADTSSVIPPGESLTLELEFDSTGMYGGEYLGEFSLDSNDPNLPHVTIPLTLTVNGLAQGVVETPNLDFGTSFVGDIVTRPFTISNQGTAPWDVSGIVTALPEITFYPSTLTLLPNEQATVYAVFKPTQEHVLSDVITIQSNLPDLSIPAVGISQLPPSVVVNPAALSINLAGGLSQQVHFQVENTGMGPLAFQVLQGRVLIIGDGVSDAALVPLLNQAGIDTYVVPSDATYEGTPAPQDFDAVLLVNGSNYGLDMPYAGQQVIREYVLNGGGLLAFEWVEAEVANGRYTALGDLLPLNREMSQSGTYEYQRSSTHPILEGIPESFSITTGSNIGTADFGEVLMTSAQAGDVLVVHQAGQGNVIQFASAGHYGGFLPFQEPHFAKLVTNSVHWLLDSWLRVFQPTQTVIQASAETVELTIKTENLALGNYDLNLKIISNDPLKPIVFVPVSLQISCMVPQDFWEGIANWHTTTTLSNLIEIINQPCN